MIDKRASSPLVPSGAIGLEMALAREEDTRWLRVPNPRILLAPLSRREAERSSRIEGTQATIGEGLEFEARGKASSPARRDDAVRIQAENNLARAQAILDLHEQMKSRVPGVARTLYAVEVLDWIFERPIFSSVQLARETALSSPTARRILQRLCDADILREAIPGRGRRPGIFVFPSLMRVAEGGEPTRPEEPDE